MSDLVLPRANWPSTTEEVRVVQFVLNGEPYLLFEDPKNSPEIFTHDEILKSRLEMLGLSYEMEESKSHGARGYMIPSRNGENYLCPGMGYANVKDKTANFEGHSNHYALGISIPHLARIAELEIGWKIMYKGLDLRNFI